MLTSITHKGPPLGNQYYCATWDWLGKLFYLKGPTFECIISQFIRCLPSFAYHKFVENYVYAFTISKVHSLHSLFSNFLSAWYATDVIFQMAFRPSGNKQEGRRYFSIKHRSYGFKTEASVLSNGLAVGCSSNSPGSTADFDMYCASKKLASCTAGKPVT